MSLFTSIISKGKAIGRSLALVASLLSAPAYAQSLPAENAPQPHREISFSFSHNNNPSLEPLMLVNNAHTLESLLNEGLWSLHPSTRLGRMALLGTAFYGQAVINAGMHELGHYQEAREAGRDILEFPLWRILIFGGYVQHSPERGKEAVREEISILSRGLALNMLIADSILQGAVPERKMQVLDGLGYAVNHVFVSTAVMDKKIYLDSAERLYQDDTGTFWRVQRDTAGIAIFNAFDPYLLSSVWGLGKYLATGNSTQTLPSPAIPQLNGYLAVPQPLYEACWYIPWKGGVVSTALRAGNAVENTLAIRGGILDFPLGRKILLTAVAEGIHSGNSNDGVAHVKILFPLLGIKIGPTFSYTSGGWSQLMNGLTERYMVGMGLQL